MSLRSATIRQLTQSGARIKAVDGVAVASHEDGLRAWRNEPRNEWTTQPSAAAQTKAAAKKEQLIRQATTDKRNRAEKAYESDVLYWQRLRGEIVSYKAHGIVLPLANGLKYNPDYYVVQSYDANGARIVIYEVKGEKRNGKVVARDDAVVKIKVAAKEYPEMRFFLVWRAQNGEWQQQEVGELKAGGE